MNATIHGSPSFAYIELRLQPGEQVIAESDAMSSMDGKLAMEAKLNGGSLGALMKRLLGGESLFVNHFSNQTSEELRLTLVQSTPGDIRQVELAGQTLCLQPGAFVACTPGVKLGLKWAGLVSGIAREGFFKLTVSGHGTLWYGAYGGLLEKEVDGEYIVDTSHLVAYDSQLKLKLQLAGGLFSSFFGGEGLVTRIVGKGKILIQTRSLESLAGWINPKL